MISKIVPKDEIIIIIPKMQSFFVRYNSRAGWRRPGLKSVGSFVFVSDRSNKNKLKLTHPMADDMGEENRKEKTQSECRASARNPKSTCAIEIPFYFIFLRSVYAFNLFKSLCLCNFFVCLCEAIIKKQNLKILPLRWELDLCEFSSAGRRKKYFIFWNLICLLDSTECSLCSLHFWIEYFSFKG